MRDNNSDVTAAVATTSSLRCAAAFLGVTGVGLGAWGSHGLPSRLASSLSTTASSKESRLGNWKTAVSYQLLHAVAILSISILFETQLLRNELFVQKQAALDGVTPTQSDERPEVDALPQSVTQTPSLYSHDWYQRAGQCMAVGSVLFSGSIYMLCLDLGPKKAWGPLTPIGGLFLMAGWTILGASAAMTGQGCTTPFAPKKGQ
jgi:uncharacterized membrane protein YgdD (TMEM256/DUF423 family)